MVISFKLVNKLLYNKEHIKYYSIAIEILEDLQCEYSN